MEQSSQPPVKHQPWSDDELFAAADAYLRMLRQELSGSAYNKADTNRQLREGKLSGRNKSSIELRMQNISAVLFEMRIPHLAGYLPAMNIGTGVAKRLKAALVATGIDDLYNFIPTANQSVLEKRTAGLVANPVAVAPVGQVAPEKIITTSTAFVRDPAVRAWVMLNAGGVCEGCASPAPFKLMTGKLYLEVHHVVPLAAKGSGTITNAVALCPNCHRRCHLSLDRDEFKLSLYEGIDRLIVEVPVDPEPFVAELNSDADLN